MSTDPKNTEELVLSEILGTLSAEERVLLMNLIENDPDARLMREQMKERMPSAYVKNYLDENPGHDQGNHVFRFAGKQKKRKAYRSAVIIATSCIILALAATWLFPAVNREITNGKEVVTRLKPSSIILQLPGGENIALDSGNRQLQAGNITLNTQNATLSYLSKGPAVTEYATLTVSPGKDYKIHLNDGSEVQLNSGTSMKFPLHFSDSREITINGEAYIKVAKDANRPFKVILPHAVVNVLGTDFNVNTYDSGVHHISLLTGSVKIKTPEESVTLKPGQEGVSGGSGILIKGFDSTDVISWTQGKYYFTDTYIVDVCPVLSRWYNATVVIDNKNAARQKFTGMIYRDKTIDVVLKALKETHTIDYYTDIKGVIHIK